MHVHGTKISLLGLHGPFGFTACRRSNVCLYLASKGVAVGSRGSNGSESVASMETFSAWRDNNIQYSVLWSYQSFGILPNLHRVQRKLALHLWTSCLCDGLKASIMRRYRGYHNPQRWKMIIAHLYYTVHGIQSLLPRPNPTLTTSREFYEQRE